MGLGQVGKRRFLVLKIAHDWTSLSSSWTFRLDDRLVDGNSVWDGKYIYFILQL